MAKVKFSALISEMRNKLNGSVFSRNRGGNYLRNKVTPINPSTSFQVGARNLLTSFAQGWRSLTQAQRDSWNAAVSSFATTDIFGDIKNPTGLQLYIRLNVNISNAGGAAILVPPLVLGSTALTTLSAVVDDSANTFILTFAPTPVPAGFTMYIEATAPVSAGIKNFNSKFRRVTTLAAGTATGADINAAYVLKFGSPVTGQKIGIRAKLIRIATGEVSLALVTDTIVVA